MIERAAKKNLLAIARAYSRATEQSLSAVGREFYGKHAFFADLRKGQQSITLTRLDRLYRDFVARWPEGTPWPTLDPITMNGPQKK